MIMAGAVHLPERGRYFKVIVFACGPNGRHEERLLNAYPVEITCCEYEEFGPTREELIAAFKEEMLLGASIEDNSLNVLKRSRDRQTAEIDISRLPTDERHWLLRMIRLYASRGLLHDVEIRDTSVAVRIDEALRTAFACTKSVTKTLQIQ